MSGTQFETVSLPADFETGKCMKWRYASTSVSASRGTVPR